MRARAGSAGPSRADPARAAPARTPRDDVLALQNLAGNQGVHALLGPARPPDGGTGLDPATRAGMEAAFGTSFGEVVVHTDAAAAASAQRLGASAYTIGPHVVFGAGQFAPGSAPGRMLIAHELAHVVQQRRGSGAPGAVHEADADRAALDTGLGRPPAVATTAAEGIARAEPGYLDRARALRDAALAKAEAVKAAAVQAARDVQERARAAVTTTHEEVRAGTAAVAETARQKAASAVTAVAPHAKARARDAVKGHLGTVEGIYLEAGSLVDTGLWALTKVGEAEDMVFGGLDDLARSAGLTPAQRTMMTAAARGTAMIITGGTVGATGPMMRGLREAASHSPVDPVTGRPIGIDPVTGAPMVSGLVTKAFDAVEGAVDRTGAFAGAEPETGLLTARETGQLAGSIGSQVGLAFVGAEEVALVLKVAGAVGSARSIEVAARKNMKPGDPTAFLHSAEFWMAVGNLALFVIGLRASSAGRKLLMLFVDVATAALATAPPLLKLARDLQGATGPDREAVLNEDYKAVLTAAAHVMQQILTTRMGGARGGKGPGKVGDHDAPVPQATPRPAGAEAPPTVLVKAADRGIPPTPKPAEPLPGGPYRPVPKEGPHFPDHPVPSPAPVPAPEPSAPVPAPGPVTFPTRPHRRDPSPVKEAPPQPKRTEIHPRFTKKPAGVSADELGHVVLGKRDPANDNATAPSVPGVRTGTDDHLVETRPSSTAVTGGQVEAPPATVASAGRGGPMTPAKPPAPTPMRTPAPVAVPPRRRPPAPPPPARRPVRPAADRPPVRGATADSSGTEFHAPLTMPPVERVRRVPRKPAAEKPEPRPTPHTEPEDLDTPPSPFDRSQAQDPSTWYGHPESTSDVPDTPPPGPGGTRSLFDDPATGRPAAVRGPRSEPEPADVVRNTPGGAPAPEKREAGSFVHGGRGTFGYAEALRHTPVGRPRIPPEFANDPRIMPLSDLPDGLAREVWLGPTKRADRVTDPATGIVYEIKPDTVGQIRGGLKQADEYARLFQGQHKLGQVQYRIVLYNQKAAVQLIKNPGSTAE